MERIIDSDRMKEKFEDLHNQDYFVNKSNIINEFNKKVGNNCSKNICITKPKRFGKTSIASMLVSYYSKGIDSKIIFDKLKVSKGLSSVLIIIDPKIVIIQKPSGKNIKNGRKFSVNKKEKKLEIQQYEEFYGRCHTIFLDFSYNVDLFKTLDEYIASINLEMKKDIEELYPNSVILNNYSDQLYINLDRLYREIGEKIIIIVDEWDSIFTNTKFTRKEQDKYVYFLKNLIKDQEYTFFVFMTGILSQTAINCFYEYSILQDEAYYQYFGFTEKEVRALCRKNKNTLKYEELESWYNGYKGYDGQRIFNPYSVIQSLQNNLIENYWTEVGHYDKLVNIINFNINGVKEEILDFILGKEISIHLNNFGVKDLQKELEKKEIESNETKEKFYSKMVTFGFLTYYDGKISIPNKELKEKFILALTENNDLKFYYGLIEKSENMLELILNKKTKEICEILKESHMNIIKLGDEMEQFKFKRFLEYVYFNANVNYNINDYVENEKGFIDYIDYIFYPKNKKKETVIIMRLKINESAKAAIRQIHENKYYYNLKNYGYEGNILLIGINCNSRTKNYSCIIEEYNSALNLLSSSELEKKRKIKPEPEIESDDTFKRLKNKKIKVKSESDGIFKRLRSSNKIKTN